MIYNCYLIKYMYIWCIVIEFLIRDERWIQYKRKSILRKDRNTSPNFWTTSGPVLGLGKGGKTLSPYNLNFKPKIKKRKNMTSIFSPNDYIKQIKIFCEKTPLKNWLLVYLISLQHNLINRPLKGGGPPTFLVWFICLYLRKYQY